MQGQSVSKIENQKPARFLYSYLSFGLDICLLSQIVFTKNAASCSFTTTPVESEELCLQKEIRCCLAAMVVCVRCRETFNAPR
jgi:hypothetical protein